MIACGSSVLILVFKVAPYNFTTESPLRPKAQVMCARLYENVFFNINFYDVNKSKTDSEFSRVSFGEIP